MDPRMEAYAYPNGYCFLTTGILNRIENEDQLAMIIAHEMVHYVRQHTVELYDYLQKPASETGLQYTDRLHMADGTDGKQKIDAAEYQADNEGLSILKHAGYREAEVLTLLSNLMHSMRDQGQSKAVGRIENRIKLMQTLLQPGQRKVSASLESDGSHAFYLKHIAPALVANAQVALQRGDWDQADCSISKFLVFKPDDARAYFIKGEILRRQNDRQDEKQCVGYYEKALSIDPKFPSAYRVLGELHFKAGRCQTAKPYFEAFLHLAPQDDAGEYIKGYLRQCRN
jgi:predicted Zn-dependent protease